MYCSACGAQIEDGSRYCPVCGTPTPYASAPPVVPGPLQNPNAKSAARQEMERELKHVIPLNTRPLAIVASYVALFSILLFPAPVALLFGLIALADVRNHPEAAGKGRAIFAIIMGVLGSALLLLLFLLPYF